MALALAAAGSEVFLSGRRKDKLQATAFEAEQGGAAKKNCHLIPMDISDSHDFLRACEEVSSLSKSLYGLVNNAALPSRGNVVYPLMEGTLMNWQQIMATNITGPWFLTRTILPHMVKGGSVRVLFVSSEAGWAFTLGFGPYNVSEAALNNLAASLAAESMARFPLLDIQMNVLVPGEALTEMNQGSSENPQKIVPMALALLSQPPGGPNGKFFHQDGRSFSFCHASAYEKPLV